MKNLVILLFMISVLIVSAFSIKCKFCEPSRFACEETEVECGTKWCMTYWKYRYSTDPDITFRKGCTDESLYQVWPISSGMSLECVYSCFGDLCNSLGFEYLDKRKWNEYTFKQPIAMLCRYV
ncbi:uncharacterized protein ACNLHF_002517 isoform 1-T2 [Anomaloglossus baeobatrachus]